MSDVVPSIPSVTPQNLVDVARKLKHLIDVREGRVGDPLDANVTYRDLVAAGIAQMPSGGAARGAVPIIAANPIEQGYDPSTDMSIPPQPTGLTAAAGLTSIQLKWNAPTYENHAYTEVWSLGADEIGNAQLIGTTTARIYVDTIGATGTQRFYWVRHVSQAAVTGAFNATAGVSATTGKIGNTDLGPLIIEAGNLADGSVQAGKLAANSIAVGTAAIQDGAIINAMIADATIDSAKIANLDAGKITSGFIESARIEVGSLDAKIAELDAAVIKTGVIDVARIGDGTITNAKIGQVIQSTTFNEGVSGWIIDKSSGIRVFANNGQRIIDIGATGTMPVLRVSPGLEILADGTAKFNGSGTFSGSLNGATGVFNGSLAAGVLDPSSFDAIQYQYTNVGTFSLTVPAKRSGWSGMSMRLTMQGGGGGGGGGYFSGQPNSDPSAGGGGGGAGARVVVVVANVLEGQNLSITIGAGGGGGYPSSSWSGNAYTSAPAGNGGAGGNTVVVHQGNSYYASGGSGGTGGSAALAYDGGGYVEFATDGGYFNTLHFAYNVPGGSLGGQPGASIRGSNTSVHAAGGAGGSSSYGSGGPQGSEGTGYGTGGGGGLGNGGQWGGGGKGGYLLIEFFDPNTVVLNNRYSALIQWLDTIGHGAVPSPAR